MIREAIYYGLWAAVCFLLTSLFVFALTDNSARELVGLLRESLPIAMAVFLAASLGWAIFHSGGRQPRMTGYGLLALAVTLIAHLFFVGLMLFADKPWAAIPGDIGKFASLAAFGLIIHGWFTIPVALLATWLFVRWRRRAAANV